MCIYICVCVYIYMYMCIYIERALYIHRFSIHRFNQLWMENIQGK